MAKARFNRKKLVEVAQSAGRKAESVTTSVKKSRLSRRALRAIVVVAVVFLVCFAVYGLARLWLSYLWYQSLGQQGVFVGRIVSQLATMAACALIALVVIGGTVQLAGRLLKIGKRPLKSATWGAVACAVISGVNMSGNWMKFRLAVAGSSFGITEPLFNRDVGFFVFRLPAIETLYNWLIGLLVLATILTLAAVFIPQRATGDAWQSRGWDLKTVASVIAALFILVGGAGGFYLALDHLELPSSGLIAGASFTDVRVRVPVLYTLVIASILLALLLLITARSHKLKLPAYAIGVWVALIVMGNTVIPTVVQSFVVNPNEATLERPYITYAIDMTRKAFMLDSIETTEYPATKKLSEDNRELAQQQLSDTCLWSDSIATATFNQLQQIRPYYTLSPLMTDRYTVPGSTVQRQMLISSRTINTKGLPGSAQNWVNAHLVYTHGYGSTMSPVNATNKGMLEFALGGVPPSVSKEDTTTPPSVASAEQRIYFAPGAGSYVITNTKLDEFDYTKKGSKGKTNRTTDIVGVKVGGPLRRVAWAIKYRSTNFLFSSYLKQDSVISDNRDIVKRANAIAPWFSWSKNAFSTIVDGRTYWVLDGFTSSSKFPYAQPLTSGADKGKNYLRASVKVVVDAATGETKFYAIGDDPIRDAWAQIFGQVILPESDIPAGLAAHLLYPKRAFDAQTQMYMTYHMTDPMTYYDKEDQWQIANVADATKMLTTSTSAVTGVNTAWGTSMSTTSGSARNVASKNKPMSASYMMLSMPDEPEDLRVHIVKYFTPANTPNLISLMTAGCDPNNYGKLMVYQLPKSRAILSAAQVSAQINQDPVIAPQLALWSQSGSNVVMGNVLVLPVADSIVYVQPVFLQAQQNAVTQLARVIMVNGNKVVMGADVGDALDKIYEH